MKIATNEARILMSHGRKMGGSLLISDSAYEVINGKWKIVQTDRDGMVVRRDCPDCNGRGMRVGHNQGDPVPEMPGYFYTSTLLVTCACATVVTSETIIPTMPWLGNDLLSIEILR